MRAAYASDGRVINLEKKGMALCDFASVLIILQPAIVANLILVFFLIDSFKKKGFLPIRRDLILCLDKTSKAPMNLGQKNGVQLIVEGCILSQTHLLSIFFLLQHIPGMEK